MRTPTRTQIDRLTVALDDLTRSDDYDAFIRAARDLAPISLVDQADAATAQIRCGFKAIADRHGYRSGTTNLTTTPPWVTLALLHTLLTWHAGYGRTCMHAPRADRPMPVSAAAWEPDLIVCGQCLHLLRLRDGSARDRTCDGCGRITEGVEHGEGIYPTVVSLGPVMYMLGACDACRWWD
ncbi:hypothetical protein [Pseudonocardia dioxanivorans]|uniref:hypothetical protein n=1 Tax=Pseudonocardia dioxanivorans TaxID=240495 RepID=UPI000CD2DBB5|nr:hypothetical protein [Pseudonocardia dioxanivorans]